MAELEGGARVGTAQARALPGAIDYFASAVEPPAKIEGEPVLISLGSGTAVPRNGISYVGIGWSTVEEQVASINLTDGQFSRMGVGIGSSNLGSATVTVTFRVNWTDTPLTVTMTGTQQGTVVDAPVNVAANDIIDCKVNCVGVANPGVIVTPSLLFAPAAMSVAAAPTPAVIPIGAYNIPGGSNGQFGPTSEFAPYGSGADVSGPLPAGKLLEAHWKLCAISAPINGWIWIYILLDGQRLAGWAAAPGPGGNEFRTVKGEFDWPENGCLSVELQNLDNTVPFTVSGALVFEAAPLVPEP